MGGGRDGGAETAFVDMSVAMHEAGETIEVITRAHKGRVDRLKAAGIAVHLLPFGGATDFKTKRQMRRIIKTFKPDIVQTWMSRATLKTPRWIKSIGIGRYLVVARLGGYYKLKYFKSADYFATITPDIKTYLVNNGIEAGRIAHINNFAETEGAGVPIDRADYGVPEDAPLLLGLGRLHPSKAFDVLIDAVARIPHAHLWIAGEGPSRAQLEAQIKTLGVENRVQLLGWRDDRAALFDAVNICVFSSRYEPFGTVFVQAWANRVPLVTTTADGPRQFVRDGEDGLIVEIDDVEAMRGAIEHLIKNQSLAN